MRVWGARMQNTGTYRRNPVVHTYSGKLDGDGSDHHDSPCSGLGSLADKGGLPSEPTQPSKFDAAGYLRLDFTKRIDAVGPATFKRFETEGAATGHRWSNELQKSPFAKFVFRETTGANRRFQLT